MNLRKYNWIVGLKSSGSGYGQVAGYCEQDNKYLKFHKMWRISYLHKDPAPCSQFAQQVIQCAHYLNAILKGCLNNFLNFTQMIGTVYYYTWN